MSTDGIKGDKKFWQRLLRLGGYYDGEIDGIIGPKSRAAAEEWAREEIKYRELCGRLDDRSEGTLATLLPQAQYLARQWMRLALPVASVAGLDVRFIGGTRTYAEQNALYAQGRTASGPKVTNARGGYSWHNFGLAVDFGLFKGKEYIGNSPHYVTLGKLADQVKGLEWGGNWTSFKDYPHLQMAKFASVTAARKEFE